MERPFTSTPNPANALSLSDAEIPQLQNLEIALPSPPRSRPLQRLRQPSYLLPALCSTTLVHGPPLLRPSNHATSQTQEVTIQPISFLFPVFRKKKF